MKTIIKSISAILSVFSMVIFSLIIYGTQSLPDKAETFSESITFSKIYTASVSFETVSPAFNSDNREASSSADIKLFGTIPVKNIQVNKSERRYLAAGGDLIGIRLKTEGVLVVGTESFESINGTAAPAEDANIKIGDTLISIDGKAVSSNNELGEIIALLRFSLSSFHAPPSIFFTSPVYKNHSPVFVIPIV